MAWFGYQVGGAGQTGRGPGAWTWIVDGQRSSLRAGGGLGVVAMVGLAAALVVLLLPVAILVLAAVIAGLVVSLLAGLVLRATLALRHLWLTLTGYRPWGGKADAAGRRNVRVIRR